METSVVAEGKKGHEIFVFAIENVYISLATITRILSSIPDVRDVQRRKLLANWEGAHIKFKYKGRDCAVVEPFGDNSLYWIGMGEEVEDKTDICEIEKCFREYRIPLHRKFLGDMLSLRFLRFLFSGPRGARGSGGQSRH